MDLQVSDRGWVLFTKEHCKYCDKAKALLPEAERVPCDAYLTSSRDEFLEQMDRLSGREYRTFPMVFYNGKFVGGYTETAKRFEQEKAFSFVAF
jgi:glutaredoxin